MSEMTARVGQAIRDELFQRTGIVLPKTDFEPIARAAIEAMREPTETMARAATAEELTDADGKRWPGEPKHVFAAMIDAALKE